MTGSSQNPMNSSDQGSGIWQVLTGDVAVLWGALLGLGIAWRAPEITAAGLAMGAAAGGFLGFLISRVLRRHSIQTRVIALLLVLLVALPIIGAIVYRRF